MRPLGDEIPASLFRLGDRQLQRNIIEHLAGHHQYFALPLADLGPVVSGLSDLAKLVLDIDTASQCG